MRAHGAPGRRRLLVKENQPRLYAAIRRLFDPPDGAAADRPLLADQPS